MRKVLLFTILIATTIFYGCNKSSIENSPVSIYPVDIESLNNNKILSIIDDDNLEEGVYQIKTDKNIYIFFKGIKNEYININSKLNNKTLVINCDTSPASKNSNKLYVIREKNTTSSNNENTIFDMVNLKINNNEVSFKSINII